MKSLEEFKNVTRYDINTKGKLKPDIFGNVVYFDDYWALLKAYTKYQAIYEELRSYYESGDQDE